MKITEELFNQASAKTVEFIRYNSKQPISDYYADIMRHLLGKEISYSSFAPSFYNELSEDNKVKLGKFIVSELCEKYNLSKGLYCLSSFEFGKDEVLDEPYPSMLFGDDIMIFLYRGKKTKNNQPVIFMRTLFYTSDTYQTAYDILNSILGKANELIRESTNKNPDEIDVIYSLVYVDETYYEDSIKKITTKRIDLSEFNEDLPDDKIQEFIKEPNKSGILIFHGEPGCGKTSYIKYLIQTNQDKQFSYLGLYMLLNQDKLREYVISRQKDDLIIVIEDCEKLLQSRNYGSSNASLSDILNISDGLIGDQTNTKFIFTFNSSLGSIDSALLRKGRLKCRYEFKPLQGERLKSLALKLGLKLSESELRDGLPLCDLYNYNSEVEVENCERKIGFR